MEVPLRNENFRIDGRFLFFLFHTILFCFTYIILTHFCLNQVGFKPAGGIRTSKDVIQWMTLMKEELGDEYMQPHLFRIGASGLLNDIERKLSNYVFGSYYLPEEMPMA